MKGLVNEWYEFIDDRDLQSTEGYDSMVLVCPGCSAFFQMKACGNRSLFEWFGYHPTDGNCNVVTEKFRRLNQSKVNTCKCKRNLERVRTKDRLDQILINFN